MSVKIEKKEKLAVLVVENEKLNGIIAPELKASLVELHNQGTFNFIIDLKGVKYIDSSGLSAILVGNRLSKSENGLQIITGLQPMVKKLIEISQLDTVLKIVPTVSEALDYIYMFEVEKDLNNEE